MPYQRQQRNGAVSGLQRMTGSNQRSAKTAGIARAYSGDHLFCGAGTGWTNCGNHSDPAPVDRRAVPQRWEYWLRRAAGRTEKGICITDADTGTGFLPQNRFGTGIAGLPGRQRRFRAHDPKMWRNLCGRSAGAGRRWPAGTDSAVLDCAMK